MEKWRDGGWMERWRDGGYREGDMNGWRAGGVDIDIEMRY
jgi:hypothetical protein